MGPQGNTTTGASSNTNASNGDPAKGLGVSAESDAAIVAAFIQKQQQDQRNAAIASWVENQYVRCRNARSPWDRQWFINLAFLSGKQYISPVEVPGMGFRLTTPRAPAHRVRLVINKIRPAVRRELAKLTSSKPIPTVVPATNEDEDVTAAAVGEALLNAQFNTEGFNRNYRSAIWWSIVCGTGYLKSYWDPNERDYDAMTLPPMPTMPDGTPFPQDVVDQVKEQRPDVKKLLETPQPAVGKICYERLTPFQVYAPNLLAEDIEDQPYIIQTSVKTPEWVRNRYNFQPSPDARGSNSILDTAVVIAKTAESAYDAVLVKECWIKPNYHPLFPEGGMVTIINSRVVYMAPKWPCPFPEFPFYKFDAVRTGGYHCDSVIVDLLPLQKEYNRTRSQAVEIKNGMSKPRLLYPQGSIDPRKITSESGGSVPYQQGYDKPQIMQPVEVPMTYINEVQTLTQEFDDISGQHEISRGTTPSGVTSATGISFLQEQDDTMISDQVQNIENCGERLGKHHLKYVSNFWTDDRVVKITGRNNSFEAMHWRTGSLKGNTDVKVQTGSALPQSKAAKQALITEWMQNGFIAPEDGMEILNMGMFDKAVEDMLVDKRQAQRENIKMSELPVELLNLLLSPAPGPNGEAPVTMPHPETGQPVSLNGDGTPFQPQPPIPVNSWDDHEQHIHWHNQYRKTQQFELLDEPNKKAFELHVQLHQMALGNPIVNGQGQTIMNQPEPSPMQGDPNGPPDGSSDGDPANQDPAASTPSDQQSSDGPPQ